MSEDLLQFQYDSLVNSLRLVAVSSSEQIASLPNFVCVTDEIVSTFGDAFLLVPQLEQAGLIARDTALVLKQLDDFFANMPRDPQLAETESLADHTFWNEARQLAASALALLGEEKRPPTLSGITWIKAESPSRSS